MKNLIRTLIIIFSISFISQAQTVEKKNTQETFILKASQSEINWTGSYLFKYFEHKGTVCFKEGELYSTDGAITGGSFLIDMTTISNEEYRLDNSNGPIGHLKNSDFFEVEKYSEASL